MSNTLLTPARAFHTLAALRPGSRRRAESGATLIEALAAMLVLSVGLLGIAGLASASLRYAQGGWARAAVASGLSDFADRVRSNPADASESSYAFTARTYAQQRSDLASGSLAIAKDCLTEACSATELATFHIADWRNSLDRSMPGAAVWVTGRRNTGYQATVMWFDKTHVQDDGTTPLAPLVCNVNAAGAVTDTGIVARNCCPDAAAAADGVRCTTLTVVP